MAYLLNSLCLKTQAYQQIQYCGMDNFNTENEDIYEM